MSRLRRALTWLPLVRAVLAVPHLAAASPGWQQPLDPRGLALTLADLPPGFAPVPSRTAYEERPDGVAVFETVFAREQTPQNLGAGPIEVRSGVARTPDQAEAARQWAGSREALVGSGYVSSGVPPLGDEAVGLSKPVDLASAQGVAHLYLFRKGPWVLLVGVSGRPDVVGLGDTVGLALVVSSRLDSALASGQSTPATPSPPPSGQPPPVGASPPPSAQAAPPPASPPTERVRIANADGSSVNVRAEPSTSAQVLAELPEGTELDLAGPDRQVDGRAWRNVKLPGGQAGWIAAAFLVSISPPATPVPGGGPPAGLTQPPGASPPAAAAAPASSPEANATPTPTTTTPSANPAGLVVEVTPRQAALSSGEQAIKVTVTRDGQPVVDARVDVTARLDRDQYIAINAPRTGPDGKSEVVWTMEGPAGTYQVLVEVRQSDDSPVLGQGAASFRWK